MSTSRFLLALLTVSGGGLTRDWFTFATLAGLAAIMVADSFLDKRSTTTGEPSK